jgi:hypothetical protein
MLVAGALMVLGFVGWGGAYLLNKPTDWRASERVGLAGTIAFALSAIVLWAVILGIVPR